MKTSDSVKYKLFHSEGFWPWSTSSKS